MGDGLKKAFAFVKHAQDGAPAPLSPVQRRILADAVRGESFVVPKERRSARALETKELVTARTAYRKYTRTRSDGSQFVTTFQDVFVTATVVGKSVHEALAKRGR